MTDVSVVIPVYNGASMLATCLRSLRQQTLPGDRYEVIVVDDGSKDTSAAIARAAGVRVIQQPNAGAPAARNTGIALAQGTWIAFTDSDCVASRGWLASLLRAAQQQPHAIGAAGKTIGLRSETPAARFVDLIGGLDAVRSMQHPRFPFAPTANVLYRREYLQGVGGFNVRYATYDACDLHTRLSRAYGGLFPYEPSALIMHKHRTDWRAYCRQQFFYGVGYAQFVLAHRSEVRWSIVRESALAPGRELTGNTRAAPGNRRRAHRSPRPLCPHGGAACGIRAHVLQLAGTAPVVAALAPKWTPRGIAQRWQCIVRESGDPALLLAIGLFIARAPRMVQNSDWRQLLETLRSRPGTRANAQRIMRLRTFWLCKPFFASHNTCYIRALTLYRFLETGGENIGLHIGIEHRTNEHERLHGHAWVTLGDTIIEAPPAALEGRIREIRIRAPR